MWKRWWYIYHQGLQATFQSVLLYLCCWEKAFNMGNIIKIRKYNFYIRKFICLACVKLQIDKPDNRKIVFHMVYSFFRVINSYKASSINSWYPYKKYKRSVKKCKHFLNKVLETILVLISTKLKVNYLLDLRKWGFQFLEQLH